MDGLGSFGKRPKAKAAAQEDEPITMSTASHFADMPLSEATKKGLAESKFVTMTDIQVR